MTELKELFSQLKEYDMSYTGCVLLGDESTKTPVKAKDTIRFQTMNYLIELSGVLYVPQLQDTPFSTLQHVRFPNCSILIKDDNATLTFLMFSLRADTGPEILVEIMPLQTDQRYKWDVSTVSSTISSNTTATTHMLHPDAIFPIRGTEQSTGYGLYSAETTTIAAGATQK
eukprot:15228852-Ditylum_brightwellii.AAC.1